MIVDPTKQQFPSRGNGVYIEWDESEDEPSGKCLDCGGYVYSGDVFCSDNCRIATAEFM